MSNTTALDPTFPGYVSFVNSSMVETAHSLGLTVKPWTIDRLNTIEQLDDLGVDGIITDYVGGDCFPDANRCSLANVEYYSPRLSAVGHLRKVTLSHPRTTTTKSIG